MSVKPQRNLFKSLVTIVLIFLYLHLLLWSTLVRPGIDVEVSWVSKSFFSSTKQTACFIRLHHHTPMALFESTFFSALALFGYYSGCSGIGNVGCGIYGTTLATFEQSMMGIQYKYNWMCFLPWIITFIQNWFHNVGEILMLFSISTVFDALNAFSSISAVIFFMALQALLASEVICMALQGWHAMKNINDENMLWEQRKRFLDGDTLNTAFGVIH